MVPVAQSPAAVLRPPRPPPWTDSRGVYVTPYQTPERLALGSFTTSFLRPLRLSLLHAVSSGSVHPLRRRLQCHVLLTFPPPPHTSFPDSDL